MKLTLCLDVGGANFSIALFRDSVMEQSKTRATLRRAGPVWMLDQMEEIVGSWAITAAIDECGIGFGGPVDFAGILYSTHAEGWKDFNLVSEVTRRFRALAVVDRDTMVGALGEGFFGIGRGVRPLSTGPYRPELAVVSCSKMIPLYAGQTPLPVNSGTIPSFLTDRRAFAAPAAAWSVCAAVPDLNGISASPRTSCSIRNLSSGT